jgi:hypothetical protein
VAIQHLVVKVFNIKLKKDNFQGLVGHVSSAHLPATTGISRWSHSAEKFYGLFLVMTLSLTPDPFCMWPENSTTLDY